MALALRSKSAWATTEDWNRHRELITRLYWDEKKTLKEVMEFMHAEHGLAATEKMYKWRFKSWGLAKNLKNRAAAQIVQDAAMGKGAALPVIRGRQLGAKRLKSYLGKITVNLDTSTLPSRTNNLPVPISPRLPDSARLSEGSLLAVVHFIRGRMQSDQFNMQGRDEYDWNSEYSLTFWQDVRYAAENISAKNNPAANFQLIDKAFGYYSVALDMAEPSLIWTSILTVLLFGQVLEDLANSFVRYACTMSRIKLGVGHPMTQLWRMIQSMTHEQLRQAATAIFNAFFASFQSDLVAAEQFRRVSVFHTTKWLFRVGLVSFEDTSEIFEAGIEDLRVSPDQVLRTDWYVWAQQYRCQMLFDARRFEECRRALLDVCPLLHQGYPEFAYENVSHEFSLFCMLYYTQMAKVLEALGKPKSATLYYVMAYNVAVFRRGENWKYRLATTSADLEAHYRRIGNLEAAERLQEDTRAHWDVLLKATLPAGFKDEPVVGQEEGEEEEGNDEGEGDDD